MIQTSYTISDVARSRTLSYNCFRIDRPKFEIYTYRRPLDELQTLASRLDVCLNRTIQDRIRPTTEKTQTLSHLVFQLLLGKLWINLFKVQHPLLVGKTRVTPHVGVPSCVRDRTSFVCLRS